MKTADFYYHLPKELIAQHPLSHRQQSKLLVMDKDSGALEHRHFYDIIDYLEAGDVLVLNNSRVIPARLYGVKSETGAKVEVLLLEIKDNIAKALVGNAKVVKLGTVVSFADGLLQAKCSSVEAEGIRIFELIYDGILYEILDEIGQMPLPPYITEPLINKERYQTVYAKIDGSAAAPTAGLHFTPELLETVKAKGIEIVEITLHVGLGTFRPVKVEDVQKHQMHLEHYQVSTNSAEILNKAKTENRKIIAVGTTTTRVLETQILRYNKFVAEQSSTDIFIYPGFKYQAIDGLITNFHLPESTLLMLVSALSSKDHIFKAYQEAINNDYRFFSFGDAMFIRKGK